MTTVLVEGLSDARAVEVLARNRGLDLTAYGVTVEVLGGITNLGARIVPDVRLPDPASQGSERQAQSRLLLLHDAGEKGYVERAVGRAGVTVERFVCDADLEDELVRALGLTAALRVVEEAGDLELWRRLTRQPYHRDRPPEAVLRRFFGTTRGRKIRYAGLLVEAAVELDRVPPPLASLLDAVAAGPD